MLLLEFHVHDRVGVKFGFKAAAQGGEVGVNVGIALDAPAGGLGQRFDSEVLAALGLRFGRLRGDGVFIAAVIVVILMFFALGLFGKHFIPLIHLVQQADAHGISLIGIAAQGGNIIALFRFVFQLVKLRGVGVDVLRLVGLFVQHFQHAGAVRRIVESTGLVAASSTST